MRKMLSVAVVWFVVLCLPVPGTDVAWATSNPVTIELSGVFYNRTANRGFKVWVEAHSDNRKLIFVCDSESSLRSSERELDGKNTPLVIRFEFRLDPGEYTCTATLQRETDGKTKKHVATLNTIIGGY